MVKNNIINDKYASREYAGSGHPDAVIAHSYKSNVISSIGVIRSTLRGGVHILTCWQT